MPAGWMLIETEPQVAEMRECTTACTQRRAGAEGRFQGLRGGSHSASRSCNLLLAGYGALSAENVVKSGSGGGDGVRQY